MIGVLALQGDFAEHLHKLQSLGVEAIPVRKQSELEDVTALIIPGGESTALGILEEREQMFDAIRAKGAKTSEKSRTRAANA